MHLLQQRKALLKNKGKVKHDADQTGNGPFAINITGNSNSVVVNAGDRMIGATCTPETSTKKDVTCDAVPPEDVSEGTKMLEEVVDIDTKPPNDVI
jgi:hypothetical protein